MATSSLSNTFAKLLTSSFQFKASNWIITVGAISLNWSYIFSWTVDITIKSGFKFITASISIVSCILYPKILAPFNVSSKYEGNLV